MITIKKDRELVKIDSWEDVENLDGFKKDIDPKEVELDAVIGKYRETDWRICGLSSCHTKHFKGYIVTTTEGHVTNIGHECGSTHFGVDFETMSRQLDRDLLNQARREVITATKHQVTEWQEEVEKLIKGDRNASWLNKEYRKITEWGDGLPSQIINTLREMVRTGNTMLVKERTATEREREALKETGQKNTDLITEEIGTIIGISGLAGIDRLRDLLGGDLQPNLKKLSGLDVDTARDSELSRWAKWSGEIEAKIKEASSIIEDGRKFFSRENIAMFAEITESKEDEKQIMEIAKKY